eukprot:CAMPEP_0182440272 /NCGR_PEP_ID=MMETSP1167-20130531/86954_1 /TAXON_ID=2988 /ORGANISM="Mallomonas Sp, Strain CCMP3275" /LENGTH=624 /DNA_ID=CAMNT_0024634177 /DNA_START=836 /DNA_END=2711 /DNA_ORIENTATION=-
MKHTKNCPVISSLPGASPALMKYITDILTTCAGVRVHPSKRLDRRSVSSYALLDLEPALFLVDGSDQSREAAARSVDAFLSAHAVLEVAWEPIYDSDPNWWVLIPRPKGMPGHLFAILDAVQWRHPYVSKPERYYKTNQNCTEINNKMYCVPGCPKTLLRRIIVSGYNADTKWVASVLLKSLVLNIPLQVSPVRLLYRLAPPRWGNTVGWSYTYGGCASNFLDCFFLDHSPCPHIDVDISDQPALSQLPQSRREDSKIVIGKMSQWFKDLTGYKFDFPLHAIGTFKSSSNISPKWYREAVGYGKDKPRHAIGSLVDIPAEQVFYSYVFRPNYRVRQEIQKRVDAFNIQKDTCSIMHVRRGDSVMHRNQGRAYIPIHAYVKAARPLMDAMGVDTVLLFTDSQTAIEEALRCEREFPEVCRGIKWRYVDKQRWKGAEGGWENPFPSGNATVEFMNIQFEFSLAQKCSMAITGNSGYGQKLFHHMCCSFPLSPRGSLPTRCVCPPKVHLSQWGFNCREGNKVLCNEQNVGGNIHLPLDLPRGIKWRYVDKQRWKGAEGGWENPFPSGNATEEFMISQFEFSLAQKCSMAVLGNSGYGNLMYYTCVVRFHYLLEDLFLLDVYVLLKLN